MFENQIASALIGNSKARRAKILFNIAREFRDVLPSTAIAELINKASSIVCDSEHNIVEAGDLTANFRIPVDEVQNLKRLGCSGKILKIKIVN